MMDWNEVKARHHVKLKPYLFIEGTLKIIVEDEVQRGKKEVKQEIKQFLIDYEEETGNPLWMALNKWCDK